MLATAAEIVEEAGIDGLTMAALAEVADYAPASLYTYFDSRSALVAALQTQALSVLEGVGRDSLTRWSLELADAFEGSTPLSDWASGRSDVEVSQLQALMKLWAFGRLFLTAPEHHPREFLLQQQLLIEPGVEDVADAASVVPAAMSVLDVPRRLLEEARALGALDAGEDVVDPIDRSVPVDLMRTMTWVTSMNGALLVDRLATGIPLTGSDLGAQTTSGLLIGWGADAELSVMARRLAAESLSQPRSQRVRSQRIMPENRARETVGGDR